jgi:hypothetical protein
MDGKNLCRHLTTFAGRQSRMWWSVPTQRNQLIGNDVDFFYVLFSLSISSVDDILHVLAKQQ